jgi:hypothetical protein
VVETVSVRVPESKLTPFSIPHLTYPTNKALIEAYTAREAVIKECNARLESLRVYTE